MLQSVCLTFSRSGVGIDNSMQGIRPATHTLLVLSLRLTALTTGWGYWGLLDQRFPNCGPRTTGGPRVLPLWSSWIEH
jgi:hypothetical protein